MDIEVRIRFSSMKCRCFMEVEVSAMIASLDEYPDG